MTQDKSDPSYKYRKMTIKRLESIFYRSGSEIERLKKINRMVSTEISCRRQGVRIGFEFRFEGQKYRVVKVDIWGIDVARLTAKGTWSINTKNARSLIAWKKGLKKSPFEWN